MSEFGVIVNNEVFEKYDDASLQRLASHFGREQGQLKDGDEVSAVYRSAAAPRSGVYLVRLEVLKAPDLVDVGLRKLTTS